MKEEPAFPSDYVAIDKKGRPMQTMGLTKREWYAAIALQGIISSSRGHEINDKPVKSPEEYAVAAFNYADAMIKESDKK